MAYLDDAISDIAIKKQTNQDSYFSMVVATPLGEMAFAVVCDGMGGLQRGELASNSLSRAFAHWARDFFERNTEPSLSLSLRSEWHQLAETMNQRIMDYGLRENIKLGTTLVVLLLHNQRYYLLNVGDSRCYCLREGLTLRTHDHALVQREVDQGILTPREARTDKRRNVLLQCVGASERIRPDFFEGEYQPGDAFFFFFFVFRHEISEEEILTTLYPSYLCSEEEIHSRIHYLVETVKMRGEKDNVTALLVKAE